MKVINHEKKIESVVPWRSIERFGPLLYIVILFTASSLSHFAILSNDSFPLRWQAEHFSLQDSTTFYNAFFPVGYPILLWMARAIGEPLRVVLFLQIVLAGVFARVVISFCRKLLGDRTALIAVVCILCYPELLRYTLSAVPDFLMTCFALFAFNRYCDNKSSTVLVGVYFGIALLFREHAIALIAALGVAIVLLERRALLSRLGGLLTFIPFWFVGVGMIAWSTHGLYTNGHAFNIWKTMHGIDWAHPPINFNLSTKQIISSEPTLFLTTWLHVILSEWIYFCVLLIGLASSFLRKGRHDRLIGILCLTASLYLLITAPGGSARGPLPVIPIVIVAGFYLLRLALPLSWLQSGTRSQLVMATAFVILSVATAGLFLSALKSGKRIETYSSIESTLGLRAPCDARRVYTDDYALYFPGLQSASPRTNGGWAEIGLPNYLKREFHVADDSIGALRRTLYLDTVKWILVRKPPINGNLIGLIAKDTSDFSRRDNNTLYTIFEVRPEFRAKVETLGMTY